MKRKPGIIQFAVFCCALGVVVSMAVPAWLQHQKRARLDQIVENALWHRAELSRWLQGPGSSVDPPAMATDAPRSAAVAVGIARDVGEVLRTYVDYYNSKAPAATAKSMRLVLEARGTSPDSCRRDGNIHLVPTVDETGAVQGAEIVVTNWGRVGGPRNDGILAVYLVSRDASAASSIPSQRRG
jgi:hypothetical protein